MKETLHQDIPQQANTPTRRSDQVFMHFPLGESQGGYGFRGADFFIKGAEVHQNRLGFPIPKGEDVAEISRDLLKIADDHRKKLIEDTTVFRALLAKKA